MTDAIKGVLGGGWALLVGWIFPSPLSAALFSWLVAPAIKQYGPLKSVSATSVASQSLVLLGAAVTLGLVLSAMQTPLYRILEGYLLWPRKLADWRRGRHILKRARFATAARSEVGYRAGLAEERRRRYPDADDDFAPTALCNAIRRFELYGWDGYRLKHANPMVSSPSGCTR